METRKKVNERISEFRENQLKMTQAEFAIALGMEERKGRSTVNNWERGIVHVKSDDLVKISTTFGVSVDYLLGITDFPAVDDDMRIAHRVTGLSEKAIKNVKLCTDFILSMMLENDKFPALIADIEDLLAAENCLNICLEQKRKTLEEISAFVDEVIGGPTGKDNEENNSGTRLDLEQMYNLVRLEKYELRDSFAALLESMAPSESLLASAKSILRVPGGLSASSEREE